MSSEVVISAEQWQKFLERINVIVKPLSIFEKEELNYLLNELWLDGLKQGRRN